MSINLRRACSKIVRSASPCRSVDVRLASGSDALIRSRKGLNSKRAKRRRDAHLQGAWLRALAFSTPASCLPACADQHVPIIRPDPAILNPGILRYFLACPAMQEKLLSWAESGGTRNALTKRTIEACFPLQKF